MSPVGDIHKMRTLRYRHELVRGFAIERQVALDHADKLAGELVLGLKERPVAKMSSFGANAALSAR
jgi:hypothetical protein